MGSLWFEPRIHPGIPRIHIQHSFLRIASDTRVTLSQRYLYSMEEVNCAMVTCNEIRNWYIQHQRYTGGLCELDCHLLERAQKFVADKNNSFLTNLSLTCNGENVYVKFYAGAQTNRFTLMVCENKIHGSVVRDGQDNGIIMIDCGDRITPQHITEYLTCCPDDCEIDRRLMQEARKYLVEMGSKVSFIPFECYGEHISYRFTGKFNVYKEAPTIACVVGNEIIIKGRN